MLRSMKGLRLKHLIIMFFVTFSSFALDIFKNNSPSKVFQLSL